MTVHPIPPWFVKRRGYASWRVTVRGWLALAVFAMLLVCTLFLLRGIDRVVLTSLVVMGFMALSVGKIDMRGLGLD